MRSHAVRFFFALFSNHGATPPFAPLKAQLSTMAAGVHVRPHTGPTNERARGQQRELRLDIERVRRRVFGAVHAASLATSDGQKIGQPEGLRQRRRPPEAAPRAPP